MTGNLGWHLRTLSAAMENKGRFFQYLNHTLCRMSLEFCWQVMQVKLPLTILKLRNAVVFVCALGQKCRTKQWATFFTLHIIAHHPRITSSRPKHDIDDCSCIKTSIRPTSTSGWAKFSSFMPHRCNVQFLIDFSCFFTIWSLSFQ